MAIFALIPALLVIAIENDPLSLTEVLTAAPQAKYRPLAQGFRGALKTRFTDFDSESPTQNEPFEYTHAIVSRRNDSKLYRELAVAADIDENGIARSASTHTRYLEKIPSIEELKKLRTIEDFERNLGEFRNSISGWGSTRIGKTTWNGSKSWMGFQINQSGDIRVVSIFLHTKNQGSGWEIKYRTIREGTFRPTGKKPVLDVEPNTKNGARS